MTEVIKAVSSKTIIEIISFTQATGTTEEQAEQGFFVLNTFYKDYDGYMGIDVARGKDGGWVLVLKWNSKENEQAASQSMMKSDTANTFKMIVDPVTMVKNLYPLQMSNWE